MRRRRGILVSNGQQSLARDRSAADDFGLSGTEVQRRPGGPWRSVPRRRLWCLCGLICLACGGAAGLAQPVQTPAAAATDRQLQFFETRIRPILVQHCYECHNSSSAAEGGLRVDDRAGLRTGGAGGPIIVPGQPEASRLLAILRHEVDGLEMPQSGPRLDDRVIADFEQWIRDGAADPRDQPPTADELAQATSWEALFAQRKQWWSFQPIRDVSPPAAVDPDWARNPIDQFIHAQLQSQQLSPAAAADGPALIRRAYFVLTGLPPSVADFERWTQTLEAAGTAEQRDAVLDQLCDELLSSRAHAECWARHWMDWIRYADSHGSEGDPPLEGAWQYRDYLIRALHQDVPYDQLVREHVAGDLLASPRRNADSGINESAIGPAHFRMVFHGFAPTDALDERVRFMDDQINAFSKAFLGLTVSCARCHDHKFDPISQRDYYALYGVLNSCRPARTVIDLPERLAAHRGELQALRQQLRLQLADAWLAGLPQLSERLQSDNQLLMSAAQPTSLLHDFYRLQQQPLAGAALTEWWRTQVQAWRDRRPATVAQPVRSWNLASAQDYADWFASGHGLPQAPLPPGELVVALDGERIVNRILPAGVYSHLLSDRDAARLTSPDVLLDGEYELWLQVLGGGGAMTRYVVQNYPRNGTVYPVPKLNPEWRWERLDVSYWKGDRIHIELTTARDAPLLVEAADRSWFGIRRALLVPRGQPAPDQSAWEQSAAFMEDAQHVQPTAVAELSACFADAVRNAVLGWKFGAASDAQAVFLQACVEAGVLANSAGQLPALRPLLEQYRRLEGQLVTPTRVPGIEETTPQDHPLFVRGDHRQPAELVPRRFLEAIDATPYDHSHSGRLRLAEDLLRDDNPLPRRVIVNRLWHHVFGRGLVDTPDNFGRMGQLPSHPELLDWLAGRLVDERWSLRRMLRLMVTSRTWRQNSTPSAQSLTVDPDNRLLSYMSVRRLPGEAIRDALLAASGTLDAQAFGVPVPGSSLRRGVYVEVRRNALDPFLRAFDFPEPFTCTGRRDITNVPAQSLTLMNAPDIGQRAQALARQLLAEPQDSPDTLIRQLYVRLFSRQPSAAEIADALRLLNDLRDELQQLQQLAQQRAARVTQLTQSRTDLLEPVRRKLLQSLPSPAAADQAAGIPEPLAAWAFDTDLLDQAGRLPVTLHGGARLEGGGLVVDGISGYAVTGPLPVTLKEKTLEAWVQLDNLQQRAGGVLTVQSRDGGVFDAIVFAEQAVGEWLAGSNVFARTQPFRGPVERAAAEQPVHLAIVYAADGRITGYRNGEPYGQAYQSAGPQEFQAGDAVVSFGVRHLPAVGNRLLAGRILQARLYATALTGAQVQAAAQNGGSLLTERQVMQALSAEQQATQQQLDQQLLELRQQMQAAGPLPETVDDIAVWTELIRSLFCLKEFVYLR